MTWKDAFKFGVMIAVGGLLVNGVVSIVCKLLLVFFAAVAKSPGVIL
jgi:hypothetical protein